MGHKPSSAAVAYALGGLALLAACARHDPKNDAADAEAPSIDGGKPPSAGTLALDHRFDVASTCSEITLEARQDEAHRPYVYVAATRGGLHVYDIGGEAASAPKLVATVPVSDFRSLRVMNLSQRGDVLYLALGNTFGTETQATGMALVDVRDPKAPRVLSVWQDATGQEGGGIVLSDGSYAYLGAMGSGLITFDVRDPTKPREVSRFVPPIDFPDARPDSLKINARGMALVGTTLYLAYDAGGLRIIDVADQARPKEIGRYSNPALNGKPRAYNNVVIDGTTAYVGVDYCGVEVLDVGQPSDVKLVSWWNPWHCETGGLSWFSSDGHVNELALSKPNNLLFVSSGKSDLEVLDVTNPASVSRIGGYGGVANGIGTWGVSVDEDRLLLTYTCALIPFASNWTGVKGLTFRR